MKLGIKPKLALHITLWALAGIALLALPALLSPAASNNKETSLIGSTTVKNPAPLSIQSNQPPSPTSATTINSQDFIFRLILVLVPAAALSGFVKNRTDKQMRNVRI